MAARRVKQRAGSYAGALEMRAGGDVPPDQGSCGQQDRKESENPAVIPQPGESGPQIGECRGIAECKVAKRQLSGQYRTRRGEIVGRDIGGRLLVADDVEPDEQRQRRSELQSDGGGAEGAFRQVQEPGTPQAPGAEQ